MKSVDRILVENKARMARREVSYDPIKGIGALGVRTEVSEPWGEGERVFVPEEMTRDAAYAEQGMTENEWKKLRCKYDFEYWCATCVKIRDKVSGLEVPLVLNAPQRRVAGLLEEDRQSGRPIRMILLKARQWGGSTLVQMYMAWIQSCHRRNWHSLICAHVKDTSSVIMGMYTQVLQRYPEELWDGDGKPEFRPFQGSSNVRVITGTGCRVSIGSSERPDSVRGSDFAMAHLSETAFWRDTRQHSPTDLIRSICAGIPVGPYTLIVMESTANGVGNYFHTEWVRSKEGKGDKRAVFVPWYEIEIYRMTPSNARRFVESWTAYERGLWEQGLCIDQIYWYRRKRKEYSSDEQMMAEFPTTDIEAFAMTGFGVFSALHIEKLRQRCREGEPREVPWFRHSDRKTSMRVWAEPSAGKEYVAVVDVGGRSEKADWSVIAVLSQEEMPEVVAQWRGHVDHDILADTAMAIGQMYNTALLVVESNSLESDEGEMYILSRIGREYTNIYMRKNYDSLDGSEGRRIGFHTNRATKAAIINALIGYVREGSYIEHDMEACNELSLYEQKPSGSFGAKRGFHDDILMTRAIGLYVIETLPTLNYRGDTRELWSRSEL